MLADVLGQQQDWSALPTPAAVLQGRDCCSIASGLLTVAPAAYQDADTFDLPLLCLLPGSDSYAGLTTLDGSTPYVDFC